MGRENIMKHKIAIAGLGIASILLILSAMEGCSAITNTIAGLTTPQSTISGSNYVYYVDPMTQRLKPEIAILRWET